jgi:uncharacterized membrane protein
MKDTLKATAGIIGICVCIAGIFLVYAPLYAMFAINPGFEWSYVNHPTAEVMSIILVVVVAVILIAGLTLNLMWLKNLRKKGRSMHVLSLISISITISVLAVWIITQVFTVSEALSRLQEQSRYERCLVLQKDSPSTDLECHDPDNIDDMMNGAS